VDPDKFDLLTEPQRECLRLYFPSQSYKDVARKLNISVEAVKDRLERARRNLGVTHTHIAAYALAVAEGRVTPPSEGWPPSAGLAPSDRFPPDMPLPKPSASVVTEVRENQAAAPLPALDSMSPRGNENEENLGERISSVSKQVLQSAQVIALIIVLAWIAMVAINTLRPGFFRFLDNLHS
jgi:DNA-binding CsgD family transcriptional regulator